MFHFTGEELKGQQERGNDLLMATQAVKGQTNPRKLAR